VLLLLSFIVFFFTYGCKVYEQYVDVKPVEGFMGAWIQLYACPPEEEDPSIQMTSRIPEGSTYTYCYDQGVPMCSLSVPQESPESCSTYYSQLLASYGYNKCPASMRTYFQDLRIENNIDSSVRGCTAGKITTDGKAPVNWGYPH
jgi:hypothetical protein